MTHVRLERKDHIVHITLDHPPLNILTRAVMRELEEALRSLEPADRAVFLVGKGAHFSAGADVAEHLPGPGEDMIAVLELLFRTLFEVPVPTVSVVRGNCLGAGLELAVACDLALVSENSRLGVPEVKLGVAPPIAAIELPWRIGWGRAVELVCAGRLLNGREAADWGLVHEALPEETLEGRAADLAKQFSALSPEALRACKRFLNSSGHRTYPWVLRNVCQNYLETVLESADGVEGLKAFLEKRKPVWKTP